MVLNPVVVAAGNLIEHLSKQGDSVRITQVHQAAVAEAFTVIVVKKEMISMFYRFPSSLSKPPSAGQS
jgi:hypothetical protein